MLRYQKSIGYISFLLATTVICPTSFCGLDSDLRKAIRKGDAQLVRALLEEGADPNGRKGSGMPLIKATHANFVEIVSLLIEAGADVNTLSNTGMSPLITASVNCCPESSELLISAGADVNYQIPSTGGSPVYYSAIKNCSRIVEQLLAAGANTDVRTTHTTYDHEGNSIASGATPLMRAKALGYTTIVNLLDGARVAPQSVAVEKSGKGGIVTKGRISFRNPCPSALGASMYMGTGKAFEVDVEAKSQGELLDLKSFQNLLAEVLKDVRDRCENAGAFRAIHVSILYGVERKVLAEALYRTAPLSAEGNWAWRNQLYAEHIHTEFRDTHGVEMFFPTGDEIVANPFRHDGKIVAFPVIFRVMETSDLARVSVPAGDLVLKGVVLDQFTQPNEHFYVAGRVEGKINVEGVGRFTVLKFLAARACIQTGCKEIFR